MEYSCEAVKPFCVAPPKSAPAIVALEKFAPERFEPPTIAPVMSALVKLAFAKFDEPKFVFFKIASVKFVDEKLLPFVREFSNVVPTALAFSKLYE